MKRKLANTSMRFLHLSEQELSERTLFPRIPRNRLTENGLEEGTIARVSFAPTVDQCLMAMYGGTDILYVYEPEMYGHLRIVENKDIVKECLVPDARLTGELWVTTPVKLKRIGVIVVEDWTLMETSFQMKDGTWADCYGWRWKQAAE